MQNLQGRAWGQAEGPGCSHSPQMFPKSKRWRSFWLLLQHCHTFFFLFLQLSFLPSPSESETRGEELMASLECEQWEPWKGGQLVFSFSSYPVFFFFLNRDKIHILEKVPFPTIQINCVCIFIIFTKLCKCHHSDSKMFSFVVCQKKVISCHLSLPLSYPVNFSP